MKRTVLQLLKNTSDQLTAILFSEVISTNKFIDKTVVLARNETEQNTTLHSYKDDLVIAVQGRAVYTDCDNSTKAINTKCSIN
jgi:hypothetical protein